MFFLTAMLLGMTTQSMVLDLVTDHCITKLGDDDFDERQKAADLLGAIGKPALLALVRASVLNGDPEIRSRASQIVEKARRRGEKIPICAEVLKTKIESVCGNLAVDVQVEEHLPNGFWVTMKVRSKENGFNLFRKICETPEIAPLHLHIEMPIIP